MKITQVGERPICIYQVTSTKSITGPKHALGKQEDTKIIALA